MINCNFWLQTVFPVRRKGVIKKIIFSLAYTFIHWTLFSCSARLFDVSIKVDGETLNDQWDYLFECCKNLKHMWLGSNVSWKRRVQKAILLGSKFSCNLAKFSMFVCCLCSFTFFSSFSSFLFFFWSLSFEHSNFFLRRKGGENWLRNYIFLFEGVCRVDGQINRFISLSFF